MAYETPPGIPDVRSSFRRRPGRTGRIEKANDPKQAFVRLLAFLSPHRLTLAVVAVLVVVQSVAGLAGPRLMGLAIDRFIAGKDIPGLARTAMYMLLVYAVANLFNLLSNWIMALVSQSALRELRSRLFSHIQTLPVSFFDTHPAGGLMSRLTSDIDAINQAVSQNIIALFSSVLMMAGIVITMFILNAWLALASLVVIPTMLGFTRFVASYTRKGFRELQKDLGELNAVAEESVSGSRVIGAFRRNGTMVDRFRARNDAVHRSAVYANSYAMLLMPLTGVLGNFFVVVLAGLGGWLALSGLATVGMIATFINYGQNFTSPLRQLANLYNSVQSALAGAERVFETLDTPSEHAGDRSCGDTLPTGQSLARVRGEVRFHKVRFSYTPGRPVLADFSLDVEAGKTVALVGPTGAGKTTVVSLLARFHEIQGGTIAVDGVDIRDMDRSVLRRNLGIVPQDTFLFADTVMENIRFGRRDATDEECIDAARRAEADHFILQLPEGYRTILTERAGNLSLGQRQLLAIARVILADPSILILDEATSSVDTRTELRIQNALLRLRQGRTSFVIAHRLGTIRDADTVVVIDAGSIVERGTHDELLARGGLYRRLYLSQFKGNEI